jgi:hypothetical protein
MSILRLVGGVSPADAADPRTFPAIWNASADFIESLAPGLLLEVEKTANYTLEIEDISRVVAVDSSSNLTVTVPTNASVPFPIGAVVNVYRAGAGEVTIDSEAGVTVRNEGDIAEQFGEVSLRKRAENEWVLAGQVV